MKTTRRAAISMVALCCAGLPGLVGAPAAVAITASCAIPLNVVPVYGSAGADVLNGTPALDVIYGGGGADTINGLGGNDILFGEDGNDTINGGDGSDCILGGANADVLYGDDPNEYPGYVDRLYGNGGSDYLDPGYWNVDKPEYVDGGAGTDETCSAAGPNTWVSVGEALAFGPGSQYCR
jgi:hypothetical protein